jgi:hypothetical protein
MKWRLANSKQEVFYLDCRKMGTSYFENFLKGYIFQKSSELDKRDFLDQLTVASGYSSEFLENTSKENKELILNSMISREKITSSTLMFLKIQRRIFLLN